MVTQISFGQLNTIGGKTVLTGSQSGIDTDALITELTTAKALPATNDQTQITANQAKITAYNSLTTALTALQTSLDTLRNPTFGSTTTNAFGATDPFLTVTGGSPVTDYIGVATSSGAPVGNYSLQVDQLATAETDESVGFSNNTSSVVGASGTNTSGQFAAGTFQINGVNITLSQNSSLTNVAAAINAESSNTNVTANIIEISPTDYTLQLSGTQTGAANAISITDPSHVLPYTTNPDSSTTQNMFTITQAAQDSQIEFGTTPSNMQTITRSTNTITDLLANTTISLYGPTEGQTVSMQIASDNSSIATAVGNFVDAYNAIRTFEAQQTQRDSTGALVTTAVLGSDTTLNTVMQELQTMISGQASIAIPSLYTSGATTTAPTRMGDLGITLDSVPAGTDANGNATPAVSNTLTLDPSVLETNLQSYFTQVANIFQFNFTSSSADLGIYSRDNTVTNAQFQIAVNTSAPIGSQAEITNIDGSGLTSPIALNYQTDTTEQSAAFTSTSTSVVNAADTDTPGAFAAGTFQLNGTNVTISQGDSLSDVANEINAADTGVTASIVESGTNSYQLELSGTAAGTSGVVITDPDGVMPSSGMFTVQSSNSTITGQAGTDLANLSFGYNGDGSETITKASPLTTKDFTIAVDPNQVSGQQALITQIFGATLTTPIAMQYTNEGTSAQISGVAGTAFSGLDMVYTGTGAETINVSMNQGIADQMYNDVTSMLSGDPNVTGSEGIVTEAINALNTQDTTLQTAITTINDQVSTYRTQLLTQFSQLEASISAANSLLDLLSAQDNAALISSGNGS